MDEYPTYSVDADGLYCVECAGIVVRHQQLWQAEAMLQQLAVSKRVELPTEWYRSQLGFRSKPLN